jgi:hypothetical protein
MAELKNNFTILDLSITPPLLHPREKIPMVPIGQEAGWAGNRGVEKYLLSLPGNELRPFSSWPDAVPTELSWLPCTEYYITPSCCNV